MYEGTQQELLIALAVESDITLLNKVLLIREGVCGLVVDTHACVDGYYYDC